jgi:hypothetical protein
MASHDSTVARLLADLQAEGIDVTTLQESERSAAVSYQFHGTPDGKVVLNRYVTSRNGRYELHRATIAVLDGPAAAAAIAGLGQAYADAAHWLGYNEGWSNRSRQEDQEQS